MKAAIYCRLSEEDKNKQHDSDDSGSIQNQKTMLIQYAEEHNWDIYDIYSDDDYAGADRKRPGFNRLLKDAEERKFDIVLCKTQSRFTRELELVEKYIHGLFPIWGIRFISIVDNADTAVKGNKKSRQINGLVNEWYLEDMSENIKSVLDSRRMSGLHIGAFALYGYKKDPDSKGHLIIDEEAASVVRKIFILFAQGYGKTAIARMLNDRGIPNPAEYKRLHGLRYKQPITKNSTLWKYSTVSSMLKNEIYIGTMVQGRYGSISYKTKQNRPRPKNEWYIVKNTHEPIIDLELWKRVQMMITQRSKPFSAGKIGLFAGKARCAYCGYVMRSSKTGGRYYLRCPNKYVSQDSCTGSFISVEKLEMTVIDEIKHLCREYIDKEILKNSIKIYCDNGDRIQRLRTDILMYRRKSEEYSKYIRELYMDKAMGIISADDYIDISKNFETERKRLRDIIAEKEEHLSKIEDNANEEDKRIKLIEHYIAPEKLTRGFVEILIDYILIGKRIQGTRDVPVEIHWHF